MKLGSHGGRFATRSAAMLLGAAALVSCAKKVDKTSLEVRVTSELAVPGALDKIVVHVQTTSTRLKDYTFTPLVSQGQGAGYTLPLSLAFTPNGDPSSPFEVDVTGMLGTSEVIFRGFKVSGFDTGKLRVLNVSLTAACGGMHCADGQTCVNPKCSFTPIDVTELPTSETDVGGNDAGAGAGGHGGAAGAGQSGHDGGAPDAAGGGGGAGAGGNGGSTGGATGMGGAAAGASGLAGTGGAGTGGAGAGGGGGSGPPPCTNDTRSCDFGNLPQLCVAGVWQKQAACVDPTPTCTAGVCTCSKTRCSTVCADLSSDPHNCGHCGHDCLMGKCSQAACWGFALATEANRLGAIAVDAQNVYWLETNDNGAIDTGGSVMKISLAGGSPIKMASTTRFIDSIATDGANVYWGTDMYNAAGALFKLGINSPTGTSPTMVADGQERVTGLVISGGFAYWASGFDGGINKVSVNGGAITPLATGQGRPLGLAVDASSVYWTTYDGGTVMKVGMNGGTPQMLASGQGTPLSIVVGGPNVFWIASGTSNSTLMKVNAAGGTPTPVVTADGQSYGLVADATNVYWFSGLGLKVIAIADGFMTSFLTSLPYPLLNVALDATSFYFTSSSDAPGTTPDASVYRQAKP